MKPLILLVAVLVSITAHALTPGRYEQRSVGNFDTDVIVVESTERVYFEYTRQVGGSNGWAGDGVIPNPTICRVRHWGSLLSETNRTVTIKIRSFGLGHSTQMKSERDCARYVAVANENASATPFQIAFDKDDFKLTIEAAVPIVGLPFGHSIRSLVFMNTGIYFTAPSSREAVQTTSSKTFRTDIGIHQTRSDLSFHIGNAGVDYGIVVPLQTTTFEDIDDRDPIVRFVIDDSGPDGKPETLWRNQQTEWRYGTVFNDSLLSSMTTVTTGQMYLVRSIMEGVHDLIIAIRVVDYDPRTQALVIDSKLIRELRVRE